MLHQRGAALHPVAVVHVGDAAKAADLGRMDMAAHHAVEPAQPRRFRHRRLEAADEGHRILHLLLDMGRYRPVGQAQPAAQPVVMDIQLEQQLVAHVPRPGEPAVIEHHRIIFIAVAHQQAAAIGGGVDGLQRDLHPAKGEAGIGAQHLVVIAGDIDDARALGRQLEHAAHHIIVALRPVPAALQLPAIDDVPHQIEGVGLDGLEEIEQQIGIAARRAEVDVGNPHAAQPQLAARRALILLEQPGRRRGWRREGGRRIGRAAERQFVRRIERTPHQRIGNSQWQRCHVGPPSRRPGHRACWRCHSRRR